MMKSLNLADILGIPELPKYIELVESRMIEATALGNPALSKPVQRLFSAHGKRLRPSLVIAVAGESCTEAINAAAAIELLHFASLVHDDIIDKADTRHGIASINAKEGNDTAIIVGDYLFAKACQLAAKVSVEAAELAASTFAQLCDGQAGEMANAYNQNRSVENYFDSIAGKTAALFASSCQIGALVAGLPKNQLKAYSDFGKNFGMAFQIIDDVLDFTATSEQAGKPVGNDVKEGVYTLPLLFALQKSRSVYEKLINDKDYPKLTAKLQTDGFIAQATAEAQKYNQNATNIIKSLNTDLAKLPEFYTDLSLNSIK